MIIAGTLGIVGCVARQHIAYNIPPEISTGGQKKFVAKLNKGMKLYRHHCDGCHGIFSDGSNDIPNFSKQQLDRYAAQYVTNDPQNHAFAENISPDQLDEILSFLMYRQK